MLRGAGLSEALWREVRTSQHPLFSTVWTVGRGTFQSCLRGYCHSIPRCLECRSVAAEGYVHSGFFKHSSFRTYGTCFFRKVSSEKFLWKAKLTSHRCRSCSGHVSELVLGTGRATLRQPTKQKQQKQQKNIYKQVHFYEKQCWAWKKESDRRLLTPVIIKSSARWHLKLWSGCIVQECSSAEAENLR